MGECQLCDDIWQMFVDPSYDKSRRHLGSLEQTLASYCPRHTPIIESLLDDGYRTPRSGERVRFWCPHGRGSVVTLDGWINQRSKESELLLVRKEGIADHQGTAQILDPEWVNMSLLEHWIAQCCGLHATCTTAMNTTPTVPALLVDVKRRCIVSGANGYRYVALSYRFG
jgi:hypothetical protein